MRLIEKLNTLGAVVVVLAVALVVDGFLFYHYQHQPPAAANATAPPPEDGSAPTTPEQTGMARTNGAAAFVHRATPESIVDNSTYVDHPSANGNPNAVLTVAPAAEPAGYPADVHNVGVWYDANRGRWAVFNQDLAPMAEGATFDVAVREGPGGDAIVHRATAANTADNETYVDSPLANGNPDAVLSVTPNWNPEGTAGTYDDHPVDVLYDTEEERWTISNRDLASMPEGSAFNVVVTEGAAAR